MENYSKVLVGMTSEDIQHWISSHNEKPFRAKQITKWLYEKHARSIDEMTDLSKALRAKLSEEAIVSPNTIKQVVMTKDGTTKFLIELADKQIIECVLIVQKNYLTACVSSQVGCNVGCPFCATGLSGFRRNLSPGEIADQYLLMQRKLEQGFLKDFTSHQRIRQVVFMGMGEPLLNYDSLIKSIRLLNNEIGIGLRHITISTSGVIPKIYQLMKEPRKYNLAISLHSVLKEKRDKLVPINKKYTVEKLLQAAKDYANQTKRRITFEYTLLKNINSDEKDAHALAERLKGIHCHINLIAYNPVDSPYSAPDTTTISQFKAILENTGFPVTLRQTHGQEEMAACGQLQLQLDK